MGSVIVQLRHRVRHCVGRGRWHDDIVVPLLIVEGSKVAWERAVSRLVADGWRADPGFGSPFRGGRVIRVGTVESATDAREALLAALAGEGIAAYATADRAVLDQLVDDLRRLGPVDHQLGAGPERPVVNREARELLGLLAEGNSLGEAAAVLGLSRRTADRRLADARRQLGTNRTTEAIARAARLGWLLSDVDPPPADTRD